MEATFGLNFAKKGREKRKNLIKTDNSCTHLTRVCRGAEGWNHQNEYVRGIRYFPDASINCVFSENFPEDGDRLVQTHPRVERVERALLIGC